ncbi:hypothetical protein CHS0354_001320 [Potamilus streckersoni]|uniref:Uncharacterized protein n=1 Tax=Potamilus streckersoni TaxID=2493646 RepID=A0AAE0VKH1_9BIVA|nr:hypothetical protein CHS0354_001320 [Potamilus streckersoni]
MLIIDHEFIDYIQQMYEDDKAGIAYLIPSACLRSTSFGIMAITKQTSKEEFVKLIRQLHFKISYNNHNRPACMWTSCHWYASTGACRER